MVPAVHRAVWRRLVLLWSAQARSRPRRALVATRSGASAHGIDASPPPFPARQPPITPGCSTSPLLMPLRVDPNDSDPSAGGDQGHTGGRSPSTPGADGCRSERCTSRRHAAQVCGVSLCRPIGGTPRDGARRDLQDVRQATGAPRVSPGSWRGHATGARLGFYRLTDCDSWTGLMHGRLPPTPDSRPSPWAWL
jgi:hypothetical protein